MNTSRDTKKQKLDYIPQRLKEVRESLLISRAEMAEKLKISSVHLHQIETYGSGSWPTIIDILIFFYTTAKINPLWIISEDNQKISKTYHENSNQDIINQLGQELLKRGFVQKED